MTYDNKSNEDIYKAIDQGLFTEEDTSKVNWCEEMFKRLDEAQERVTQSKLLKNTAIVKN